jgi:hypothetical protein
VTTAIDFFTYSRSFPCPRHGPTCRVCGSRGLWVTWNCGIVGHLDALRAARGTV